MSFEQQLARARELLIARGIKRPLYAPTFVTLLWRAGLEIPPPHFGSFLPTFLVAGSVFGTAWGLVMWTLFWSRQGISGIAAVRNSLFVAMVAGAIVASYYRYSARKHAIPSWREFKGGAAGQ